MQVVLQIAKALIGLRDATMIDVKVIELRDNLIEVQSSTLQAQAEQSALIQEVYDLKQNIMEMEKWEEEKQRYQLIEPWSGCFIYALKEASKSTEIPHWICEHCYQDGRKAILQDGTKWDRHTMQIIKCSHCSFWNAIRGEADRKFV